MSPFVCKHGLLTTKKGIICLLQNGYQGRKAIISVQLVSNITICVLYQILSNSCCICGTLKSRLHIRMRSLCVRRMIEEQRPLGYHSGAASTASLHSVGSQVKEAMLNNDGPPSAWNISCNSTRGDGTEIRLRKRIANRTYFRFLGPGDARCR